MGSDSIPQKLSDESINGGLVYAQMHFIAQTQKILLLMSQTVDCQQQNTPSMHHPRRRNVTTSTVGLKNSHIRKNLTLNDEPQRYSWKHRRKRRMVKPRDIAGNPEEEEEW